MRRGAARNDKLAAMPANRSGAIHLFRVAGIDVFLHWSWFLIAVVEIGYLRSRYSSLLWSALEYLSLFLIVLLHEFGHALACRQVGGTANKIMLWPLGGVAYVDPPPRPGAVLWSLAAGPLVNVALLLPLGGAFAAAGALGWSHTAPDAYALLYWIGWINLRLLLFNLLPVYPLDGGQILRSLLWFFLGRGRSLMAATVIGFIGAGVFLLISLWSLYSGASSAGWLLLISAYMLMNCWNGWKTARVLIRMEKLPRREGYACPNCQAKPPLGPHWRCAQCQKPFDTFESGAACPWCGAQFSNTMCMDCQKSSPIRDWMAAGSYQGATAASSRPMIDQRPIG